MVVVELLLSLTSVNTKTSRHISITHLLTKEIVKNMSEYLKLSIFLQSPNQLSPESKAPQTNTTSNTQTHSMAKCNSELQRSQNDIKVQLT